MSAATVDEALDQWGVAFITELGAIEARLQVIQEDYDENVQQKYKDSAHYAGNSIEELIDEFECQTCELIR